MKAFFGLVILCSLACAQDIQLYSEFQRFGPFGQAVEQDRDLFPREILSPAVPRNGHLTVHAVVTAPAGTNYFVYLSSNPPGILGIHLYREYFRPCGLSYCPDWLIEQRSPTFGAMPESLTSMQGQTTRCYLIDIYVPRDVPPRRVRVEALLKTGIWMVAPMEVRVIAPEVPEMTGYPNDELIAPVTAPSSDTALLQLLRYDAGLAPVTPPRLIRVRDFIQRNAAEDFALAISSDLDPLDFNFFTWTPLNIEGRGAEWYLRVRDFINRNSVNAH